MKKPRRGKVLSTQLLSDCAVSKTKRLQSRALSSTDKAFLRHQRGPCPQNLPGSSPLHIETHEGRGAGHHSTYTPGLVLSLLSVCPPGQRLFSLWWVWMPFRRKTQFSFPLNKPMFLSPTSSPSVYFSKEMAFEVLTSWKLTGRGRHSKHLKACPHLGWNMVFFKGLITVFGIHRPYCSFKVKKNK